MKICSLVEPDFEFPAFITCNPPIDIWQPNRPQFLYAGLRIKPARGMEQTMQAIFPPDTYPFLGKGFAHEHTKTHVFLV